MCNEFQFHVLKKKMDNSASDLKDYVPTSGGEVTAMYLKVVKEISLHWFCMYMF